MFGWLKIRKPSPLAGEGRVGGTTTKVEAAPPLDFAPPTVHHNGDRPAPGTTPTAGPRP